MAAPRHGLPRRVASEVKVHAQAAQAGRRTRQRSEAPGDIAVGPWTSELGFELLYWIPFVRRALRAAGVAPERVVAISRGGAGSWYSDFATRYVDLLDHVPPERLREEQQQRIAKGGQKHTKVTAFDREMLRAAGVGRGDAVLHPSLMYRRYRAVWLRRRSIAVVERELDVAPLAVEGRPPDGLRAGEYIAVKAYFSDLFPRTPENLAWLVDLLERLADRSPVVLLHGAAQLDDHEDAVLEAIPGVRSMPPPGAATNLAEQAAVVRAANMLVTTYGGFSYLGPLLGVPVCAYHSRDAVNTVHVDVLRSTVRRLRRHAEDPDRIQYLLFDTRDLPLMDRLRGRDR
jgi:hypothetical protein